MLARMFVRRFFTVSVKTKKSGPKRPVCEIVNILRASDEALVRISRERLLALNLKEMKTIQRQYRKLERNPTDAELECLAQTWSEHCKHKVFNGIIHYTENGREETIDNLFKNTIVAATENVRKRLGARDWCVSVFEDNAGVVKFDENFNMVFKVETHNHPSALDPYGGANTGIGGVIRDPLGTGLGARPIFNTDVFCFAPPDYPHDKLPKGVLHPKRIYKGVVAGVRDYGNRMGIPTINGSLHFDERYLGNPLVYCGTAGLIPVNRCNKHARAGDLIVAVGGRTGRDGIHGATFSSIELETESETSSGGAVQIGNPIVEKKMLDVILKAQADKLYDCITDCGAGGFSSAVGEMGRNVGAEVDLEAAPLKYGGLHPWEILLSEAQERMVLSVPPHKLERFMRLCNAEDVEAVVIGRFTGDKKLTVRYKGEVMADLPMSFLHHGLPRLELVAEWKKPEFPEPKFADPADLTPWLLKVLASHNVASKEWVIRQYDHEVQGASIIKPLQGRHDAGPGDAAVVAPVYDSTRGIAVSNGIAIRYGDIDTYNMAASAIDEALRGITAVGGDPAQCAILDNFCWGNPENPQRLGDLVRAARACHDIATACGTPFISGKDSFHNEFSTGEESIAVPPTLLISAMAIVPDIRKCVTMDFKQPGNPIYIIGITNDETGGSQYYQTRGFIGNRVPGVDAKTARATFRTVAGAIRRGQVRACHDCSDGGIAVALAEMAFAGELGAIINANKISKDKSLKRNDSLLFSESNTRFILEVDKAKEKQFRDAMKNITCAKIGEVTNDGTLLVQGAGKKPLIRATWKKLLDTWRKPLAW